MKRSRVSSGSLMSAVSAVCSVSRARLLVEELSERGLRGGSSSTARGGW